MQLYGTVLSLAKMYCFLLEIRWRRVGRLRLRLHMRPQKEMCGS